MNKSITSLMEITIFWRSAQTFKLTEHLGNVFFSCKLFLWFCHLRVMLFLSVAWQHKEKIDVVMSGGGPEGDEERGKTRQPKTGSYFLLTWIVLILLSKIKQRDRMIKSTVITRLTLDVTLISTVLVTLFRLWYQIKQVFININHIIMKLSCL